MTVDLHRLHRLAATIEGALFAALSTGIPGLSRHQARQAIIAGLVRVDGTPVMAPNHQVARDARLEIDLRHGIRSAFLRRRHGAPPAAVDAFRILHQDRHLIVVDKAPGVLSAPVFTRGEGRSPERREHVPELLRKAARRQGHDLDFIGLVHRLDADTSGCLCFALTRQAQQLMQRQFAGTAAGRIYRCLVHGQPRQDAGTISGVMRRGDDGRRMLAADGAGKEAETRYRVLRRGAHGAELEVELGTGRTHQIRVALKAIGCAVYGDAVYARATGARAPRMMLHALRLELDHPSDGRRLVIEAPVPAEYTAFADAMFAAPPAPAEPRRAARRPKAPAARDADPA